MDMALIIAGGLCLFLGVVGCFLPVLPGPPLAYLGLLAMHLSHRVQFSTAVLAGGLAMVVAVTVLDLMLPAFGARRWGGTRWGVWGCVAGSLIGLIFIPPVGFIGGSFLGAVVGELLGGKQSGGAFMAGIGTFLGFLLGTVLKLAVCGVMVYWFIGGLGLLAY